MKKSVIAVLVTAIVGTALWVGVSHKSGTQTSTVLTAVATVGDVQRTASATGSIIDEYTYALSAGSQATLTAYLGSTLTNGSGTAGGSSSSMTAESVSATIGDHVQAGQELAVFSSTQASNSVTAAKANLSAAGIGLTQSKSQLSQAKATLSAAQTALDAAIALQATMPSEINAGAVVKARADVTAANNQVSSAKVGVAQADAKKTQAKADLSTARVTARLAVVTAPRAGIIRASSMAPGAQGGSLTLGSGRQLVSAAISEYDVTKVNKGDSVNLSYAALNRSGTGTVLFVGQQPDSTSGTKTYTVIIEPQKLPENLALGMSVTATIMLDSRSNVLYVPSSAVVTTNGQSTVEVLTANGVQITTPIEIGLVGDSTTEVTSGLAENDNVVIGLSGTVTTSTNSGSFGGGGFGGPPMGRG